MNKRASSSMLFFYDLYGDGMKIQVMADARYYMFLIPSVINQVFVLRFKQKILPSSFIIHAGIKHSDMEGSNCSEFIRFHSGVVKRGDIVGVTGCLGL